MFDGGRPWGSIRVEDLAYELDLPAEQVLALCETLGIPSRSASKYLNGADADMVRRRAVRDGRTYAEPFYWSTSEEVAVGAGVDAAMVEQYEYFDGDDADPAWEDAVRSELADDPSIEVLDDVVEWGLADLVGIVDGLEDVDSGVEPPHCAGCVDHGQYLPRWRQHACCCALCRQAPIIPISRFPLCGQCHQDRLCRICGQTWAHVKGRCDTCRKYFARNGVERPRHLIKRRHDRLTLAELEEAREVSAIRAANPYFRPRR